MMNFNFSESVLTILKEKGIDIAEVTGFRGKENYIINEKGGYVVSVLEVKNRYSNVIVNIENLTKASSGYYQYNFLNKEYLHIQIYVKDKSKVKFCLNSLS